MDLNLNMGPSLTRDEVFLISETLKGNSQPQWNMYWSRVRFAATSATAQAFVIAPTTVTAFSYGQGASATAAGLIANATPADTSLQNAFSTINGEYVLIRGLSIFILSNSDPILAKSLGAQVSVTSRFGATTYQHGIPDMSPGWGGITGFSESNIAYPQIDSAFVQLIGGLSNGAPIAGNTVKFPRSLIWMPQGGGNTAAFSVQLQSYNNASMLSNEISPVAARAAGTAGATYNGAPEAFTVPTIASNSVFVDYLVALSHVPFYLQ